jgi:hypothetical protein
MPASHVLAAASIAKAMHPAVSSSAGRRRFMEE